MKRLLTFIFTLPSACAMATLVSIQLTNQLNQPDTNLFKIVPLSGPSANAGGGFNTVGPWIAMQPDTNGYCITNLNIGNYLMTNRFLGAGIMFRVWTNDLGSTVYPLALPAFSGPLPAVCPVISGGNQFVTVIFGTNTPPTYQMVTNALGGAPVMPGTVVTNIASLGFVTTNFGNQVTITNPYNLFAGVLSSFNTFNLYENAPPPAAGNTWTFQFGSNNGLCFSATPGNSWWLLGTNGTLAAYAYGGAMNLNFLSGTTLNGVGLADVDLVTNAVKSLSDTNGAASAAGEAATNAIGVASGLSAFVSTNRFDVAGAAAQVQSNLLGTNGVLLAIILTGTNTTFAVFNGQVAGLTGYAQGLSNALASAISVEHAFALAATNGLEAQLQFGTNAAFALLTSAASGLQSYSGGASNLLAAANAVALAYSTAISNYLQGLTLNATNTQAAQIAAAFLYSQQASNFQAAVFSWATNWLNTNDVNVSRLNGTLVVSMFGDLSGGTNYQGSNIVGAVPLATLALGGWPTNFDTNTDPRIVLALTNGLAFDSTNTASYQAGLVTNFVLTVSNEIYATSALWAAANGYTNSSVVSNWALSAFVLSTGGVANGLAVNSNLNLGTNWPTWTITTNVVGVLGGPSQGTYVLTGPSAWTNYSTVWDMILAGGNLFLRSNAVPEFETNTFNAAGWISINGMTPPTRSWIGAQEQSIGKQTLGSGYSSNTLALIGQAVAASFPTSGAVIYFGGVVSGQSTNVLFSAAGTNAIASMLSLIIGTPSSAGFTNGFITVVYVSGATGIATNFNGPYLDSLLGYYTNTITGWCLAKAGATIGGNVYGSDTLITNVNNPGSVPEYFNGTLLGNYGSWIAGSPASAPVVSSGYLIPAKLIYGELPTVSTNSVTWSGTSSATNVQVTFGGNLQSAGFTNALGLWVFPTNSVQAGSWSAAIQPPSGTMPVYLGSNNLAWLWKPLNLTTNGTYNWTATNGVLSLTIYGANVEASWWENQ